MDITVYFLKKQEKMNNDSFAFKHVIRLNDFPEKKYAWTKLKKVKKTNSRNELSK